MSYETVYEFLLNVSNQVDKISALKNADKYTKDYLKYAFDPNSKFNLPEGLPDIETLHGDPDIAPIKLRSPYCFRQMEYFIRMPSMERSKREGIFINLIKGMHPDEIKVLVAIKDQNLHKLIPGITKELIDSTFPGLL